MVDGADRKVIVDRTSGFKTSDFEKFLDTIVDAKKIFGEQYGIVEKLRTAEENATFRAAYKEKHKNATDAELDKLFGSDKVSLSDDQYQKFKLRYDAYSAMVASLLEQIDKTPGADGEARWGQGDHVVRSEEVVNFIDIHHDALVKKYGATFIDSFRKTAETNAKSDQKADLAVYNENGEFETNNKVNIDAKWDEKTDEITADIYSLELTRRGFDGADWDSTTGKRDLISQVKGFNANIPKEALVIKKADARFPMIIPGRTKPVESYQELEYLQFIGQVKIEK